MIQLLKKAKNKARRLIAGSAHSTTASINAINEAINFDLQSIFIAVPKTGTTSVRTQIKPRGNALVPNPHLNIIQVRDLIYPFLLRTSLGKNRSYPSRNVLPDKTVRDEAQYIFNNFFKFSAVRNPWARAVSLYFRREGVQTKSNLTFEAFCEQHSFASDTCLHPTLHENQFDWLCDESGEMVMDFVYKVEEFHSAIEEISERTEGRVQLSFKSANKNPESKSSDYRDMYNAKTKQLIAKSFEKDIDFFKYSF